jgi:hypothetical protein
MMSGAFTWTIDVGAAPKLALAKGLTCELGQEVSIAVAGAPESWKPIAPPEGSTCEAGQFRWKPPSAGAWRIAFALTDGEFRQVESTQIVVTSPEKKQNRPPRLLFVPEQEGREGETLEFDILAWDPDGDHVAVTCANPPAGASIDGNTGRFSWKVGATQRGTYALEFAVTDGDKTEKKTVPCVIAGAPLFRGIFKIGTTPDFASTTDWMLTALRHPDPQVRLAAAERLAQAPRSHALAEAIRLSRDVDPKIAEVAWGHLRTLQAGELDMFLDRMPRAVWQFVDQPSALADVTKLCTALLADKSLLPSRAKELKALQKDVEIIEAYNKDRTSKPPVPPVTDKKFK